jgi:hypothetical protein
MECLLQDGVPIAFFALSSDYTFVSPLESALVGRSMLFSSFSCTAFMNRQRVAPVCRLIRRPFHLWIDYYRYFVHIPQGFTAGGVVCLPRLNNFHFIN